MDMVGEQASIVYMVFLLNYTSDSPEEEVGDLIL